jgi:hypothetical protein
VNNNVAYICDSSTHWWYLTELDAAARKGMVSEDHHHTPSLTAYSSTSVRMNSRRCVEATVEHCWSTDYRLILDAATTCHVWHASIIGPQWSSIRFQVLIWQCTLWHSSSAATVSCCLAQNRIPFICTRPAPSTHCECRYSPFIRIVHTPSTTNSSQAVDVSTSIHHVAQHLHKDSSRCMAAHYHRLSFSVHRKTSRIPGWYFSARKDPLATHTPSSISSDYRYITMWETVIA